MELINKGKLWDDIISNIEYCEDILEIIDKQPTIEAEPVRHGYWKPVTMSELTGWNPEYSGRDPVGCYVCSCCGCDNYINEAGEDILSNYCPHCGAKMEVNDGTD